VNARAGGSRGRKRFGWLVTSYVLDVNLAHAVRGPKYLAKKGKTPVFGRRGIAAAHYFSALN
jgi:hypothetical protein